MSPAEASARIGKLVRIKPNRVRGGPGRRRHFGIGTILKVGRGGAEVKVANHPGPVWIPLDALRIWKSRDGISEIPPQLDCARAMATAPSPLPEVARKTLQQTVLGQAVDAACGEPPPVIVQAGIREVRPRLPHTDPQPINPDVKIVDDIACPAPEPDPPAPPPVAEEAAAEEAYDPLGKQWAIYDRKSGQVFAGRDRGFADLPGLQRYINNRSRWTYRNTRRARAACSRLVGNPAHAGRELVVEHAARVLDWMTGTGPVIPPLPPPPAAPPAGDLVRLRELMVRQTADIAAAEGEVAEARGRAEAARAARAETVKQLEAIKAAIDELIGGP